MDIVKNFNHLFFKAAVAGWVLLFCLYSPAEAVHRGAGDLTCGGCHTMHNSQGSSSLGGASGGSMILLRANVSGRQEIHKLCLQCHSDQGVQATTNQSPHSQVAPKVHNTADTWTEGTAINLIGAGGNFYPELNASFALSSGTGWTGLTVAQGRGHSLGLTNVAPPGGDQNISAFSCTSCHDPHGTTATTSAINVFRNLKVNAFDAGANSGVSLTTAEHTSWVGGVTGTFAGSGNYVPQASSDGGSKIWPVIKGTPTGTASSDAANSNSYGGASGGISRWCAQCHDSWHELLTAGNYAAGGRGAKGDWNRHPVDNVLDEGSTNGQSGAGVDIFDNSNYSVTTAGQVLPVANATGTANRTFYIQSATTDKVMCLSCHFAHGGPNNDNLRWDYTSAVGSGTQTGKGIPSTRGCQLCHNR